MSEQTSVQQQTIVVTGAGSGMGRATAELFLREGWIVIALDVAFDPTYEPEIMSAASASGRGPSARDSAPHGPFLAHGRTILFAPCLWDHA